MDRIKLVGLALLAVLAVSVVASASASASGCYCWKVAGSKLEAGKTETLKGEGTSVLEGKALGFVEIVLTCKAKLSGKIIGGQPGTDEATIVYTGCKSNSSLCEPEEPIEMKAKSEIVLLAVGGKDFWGDLLSAKEASGVLAVIKCQGGLLTAELTGSVVGLLLNEGKESIEVGKEFLAKKGYVQFTGAASTKADHLNGEETTDELKWEGTTAKLEGTSEVTLNSGKAYGVY
jgi:hypothetical protein